MTMSPDAWGRLNEMWEVMLRLSDDALQASRQQDADAFWRCVERQQQLVRQALTIKAAQQARHR